MATAGKRKEREKPKKLTEFFSPATGRVSQDGHSSLSPQHSSSSHLSSASRAMGESDGAQPPQPSSPSTSPIKQKRRISAPNEPAPSDHSVCEEMDETNACGLQLDAFPTTGQTITDITMKDMLLTLRGALQKDMAAFMKSTHRELSIIGDRVDYVEQRMDEFTGAHNELVDAHSEIEEELKQLKLKVADIEDRSRRNNIKFRGIPEAVKPADLTSFLQQLMMKTIPELTAADVTIDRAHRLPKPAHIPDTVPRDVIARIHFYHVKDQLMRYSRQNVSLPDPYAGISLYADLSQATLSARNNLIPITKILRNHKILYKWGFPAKLTITMNNASHTINSLDRGLELLRQWGLLPRDDNSQISASRPGGRPGPNRPTR